MATYQELMADPEVQATMAALQAQHPGKRLRPVETAAGVFVFRQPTRPEYNYFRTQILSDDKNESSKAFESLVTSCVVHPPLTEAMKLLEDFPGISADKDVVATLSILSGLTKDASAKR